MDFSKLPYLTFLAPFVLFFQQTKSFVLRVIRLFWKEKIIPSDLTYWFYTLINNECRRLNLDDYEVNLTWLHEKKTCLCLPAIFKISCFEIYLYKRIFPIFVYGLEGYKCKIRYLKFSFPFEKFLIESKEKYIKHVRKLAESEKTKKRKYNSFNIRVYKGRSLKDISSTPNQQSQNSSPSSNNGSKDSGTENLAGLSAIYRPSTIFNDRLKDRVLDCNLDDFLFYAPNTDKNKYQFTETGKRVLAQVEKWIEARTWFYERNVSWRRGILLNGKPGNGKSSLVLEVAKEVGLPIYKFELSCMDNQEFTRQIEEVKHDHAILLFEDFDTIFNGRTNLNKSDRFGGLTFDCFINILSGIDSITNKFVFITTNHLQAIDPAIIRPGRIDEVIDVPPLNKEEKFRMASVMLSGYDELINKAVFEGMNDSTAEFENRCTVLALENFWK